MLNLDPAKLLVIAVVAIILLGPDRLPRVARQAGDAWRSFNDYRHRMESQVRATMPDLPSSAEIARLARSPSALLNHLSTMSPEREEADGSGVADDSNPTPSPAHAAVSQPDSVPPPEHAAPPSTVAEPSGMAHPGLN